MHKGNPGDHCIERQHDLTSSTLREVKQMDERIARLQTPDECERFAKNAIRLDHPELANQARRRAIERRAAEYGASSEAEKECLQAIYASEEVLSKKNGRRTRASRTWQMIERHGIIAAAERAVNRRAETAGYKALAEMGLQEFAFESVILRHPGLFSEDAVQRSQERMQEWLEDGT